MIYLILFFLIIAVITGYVFLNKVTDHFLNSPAENSPANFLPKKTSDEKVIVNIGDSITRGLVSHNYSKIIENEAAKYGYTTVNAGINADLAYSVVQRMDEIIACKPAIATILIGGNDVISTFEGQIEHYWKNKRIPNKQETSLNYFLENVQLIIRGFKFQVHHCLGC